MFRRYSKESLLTTKNIGRCRENYYLHPEEKTLYNEKLSFYYFEMWLYSCELNASWNNLHNKQWFTRAYFIAITYRINHIKYLISNEQRYADIQSLIIYMRSYILRFVRRFIFLCLICKYTTLTVDFFFLFISREFLHNHSTYFIPETSQLSRETVKNKWWKMINFNISAKRNLWINWYPLNT